MRYTFQGVTSVRGLETAVRKPAFFWCALFAGAVLLAAYIAGGWSIMRHPAVGRYPPAWRIERLKGAWVFLSVNHRDSAFITTRRGDRIVSVDGDRRAERTGLAPFLPFLPPGGVVRLSV